MKLNLFPAPRNISVKQSRVDLAQASWIVLPQGCSRRLRERVQESAASIGQALNKQIRVAPAAPQLGEVLLEIRLGGKKQSEQGFALTLSASKRQLVAGGEAGAFYGMLAVAQLIEQFGLTPPALTISDAPDFAARGVMLDVSRCKVLTMESCKQLIDRFAGMRLNQVQLYIEHTFAFSEHQAVWHDASPFTHEEILELDQFCSIAISNWCPISTPSVTSDAGCGIPSTGPWVSARKTPPPIAWRPTKPASSSWKGSMTSTCPISPPPP